MKIKEVARIVGGATPSTQHPEYYDGNIVWATPKDLAEQNAKYFYSGERNISELGLTKCSAEMIPADNILMSSRAPIGLIAINAVDCCTNQGFKSLVLNHEKCDTNYMYYYMKFHLKEIKALGSGTTFKEISKTGFEQWDVELPPVTKQKRIGKILADIDKRIEINNTLSSKFESLVRMIYDYWFLQFDFPDENGNPYRSSGGKMVWNDELKREIPEGWGVQPLSHFIAYSKNGDWGNEKPKKASDICVNCFRGADFASITNDYHMTAPVRYISAKNKDRLLADGDLVTEISGGSPTQATGRIGYINKGFLDRSKNDMTCSNFCKAFTPFDKSYQYWLYQTWKFLYDIGAMFNYESKTTGIKNLMFDEFVAWNKVPEPNRELALLYQKESDLYYGEIQSLLIENQELASLRDFLLPLLMNGQVTFKEAEGKVEQFSDYWNVENQDMVAEHGPEYGRKGE